MQTFVKLSELQHLLRVCVILQILSMQRQKTEEDDMHEEKVRNSVSLYKSVRESLSQRGARKRLCVFLQEGKSLTEAEKCVNNSF